MTLAVTALYAGLLGLWLVFLSITVIRLRRKHKVSILGGGVNELELAIRAHGNASEYIPIALILMGLAEVAGTANWLLHLAGLVLVAGRLMHGGYFLAGAKTLNVRVVGMILTISVIAGLAIRLVLFALGNLA